MTRRMAAGARFGQMGNSARAQIETYQARLDDLIRLGREIRDGLTLDPANPSAVAAVRAWQQDCGVTVNELSGGSKTHWLARSFSEAFLVRAAGAAVEAASPVEIADRLLGVLELAVASLSRNNDSAALASSQAPAPRRFDFVHDLELRPVLEQAYGDGRRAFEQADYDLALVTYCGILEAVVTDALRQKGLSALKVTGLPSGEITDWSFDTRLDVAEQAGLIRGSSARLPAAARTYRELADTNGKKRPGITVSERDARVTGQVLHVVMRDLNPGR